MKMRLKPIITAFSLLATGYFAWKIFTNPTPIPEILTEEPAASPSAKADSTGFPTLTVGNETISPADLQWELDLHLKVPQFEDSEDAFELPKPTTATNAEPVQEPSGPELRERIITSVIERKILYKFIEEKAKVFDLSNPSRFGSCLAQLNETAGAVPDFFASAKSRDRLKTKLCEQSIIEQYLNEHVFSSLKVSPSEISSYYRTHERDFKKPARITLRQILVASEDLAHKIRKEVKRNNFAELARQYSIAPEAGNGGLIGPFAKEQLPTLFDIVFNMEVGDISGVVKSEFGYHIMMPVQHHPQQTATLTEASPKIQAELLRLKKNAAYQKWLNTAMNVISVTSPTTGLTQ